jgi:adhesin transport system membrane fusion protein
VQSESRVEESAARYRAALASAARLRAEVNETPLEFSAELDDYPELIAAETRLYETRRNGLESSLQGISETRGVVKQELDITRSLAQAGAASNVEVLRLQRQISELDLQAADKRSEYMIMARESLAKSKANVDALSAEMRGRSESLSRTTVYSPMRGIVKDIEVTTQGGVIPPNGRLMVIVPLDDQLLIRARVSPRDIAFIYPGQPAKVKITAFDYSIYGGLGGEVVRISPDTIQDEVKPEIFYYEVLILTKEDALENDAGKHFPIVPGMIATVDIRTGEKTIFDYLVKPINQAKEALRER